MANKKKVRGIRYGFIERGEVEVPIEVKEYEYRQVEEVVDGEVILKTIRVEVNPKNRFKGLEASDFTVKSLLKAGATDLLKNRVSLNGSTLDTVSNIEAHVSNIEANLNNIEKNNE